MHINRWKKNQEKIHTICAYDWKFNSSYYTHSVNIKIIQQSYQHESIFANVLHKKFPEFSLCGFVLFLHCTYGISRK